MTGRDDRPDRSVGGEERPPTRRRSSETPPEQVGPYRVGAEVGRGGMGVVYRAWDTRLERPVALKSIPARVAADPDRLERLRREARSLAAVNHPNVATIFGLEEEAGLPFLVLEFVEGESLASRLRRGSMGLGESLDVTAQVAAGLAAAHSRGVIHRDLKPSNVMITPNGTAKILDFGLARGLAQDDGDEPLTDSGVVVGTPGYMSPEHLRGDALDQRTDVWGFGCLLFECLSGAAAFPGRASAARLAATQEAEPDWTLLPADMPAELRALVRRCLAKEPRRRLRSLDEVQRHLRRWQTILDAPSSAPAAASRERLSEARTEGGTRSVAAPWSPRTLPEKVGPCRPLRLLGRGSMGEVHLAEMVDEHPDAPAGAHVALKMLHPHLLDDATARARFEREARLGARLDHDGVVRCLDAGVSEIAGEVVPYLVAELVAGRTLRALMDQLGTVPEALLRHVALQLGRGLAAVHALGAVHRDVKPANVLVTPDHQVKLMDLGVAFVSDRMSRVTTEGGFVGTVAYAAPEQVRGETAGPSADLYALGVVLYEAATGTQPFLGGGVEAVMERQLHHEPRRARELVDDVSPFFDELLASLLAKAPADRPESAEALVTILEQAEASEWWIERSRRASVSRRRGRVPRLRVRRETALLGRDEELGQLREALSAARAGDGAVVLVDGEAGVGKSRLVDELLAGVASEGRDVRVLCAVHAPESAASGTDAVARSVVEGLGEGGLEPLLARHLQSTPRLVPSFAALVTGQPPPRGSEPLSPDAAKGAYQQLAVSLSRDAPLAWVFEDLHHAGVGGRALFLALARAAVGERILLVGTARPGLPADFVANLTRLGTTRVVDLRRLEESDVEEMLAEALGSDRLAHRLAPAVSARTDGNPLFVLEVLADLRRSEAVSGAEAESAGGTGPITSLEVPSTVRSLIQARLESLSRDERELLDVAAVQGFAFEPDLVARVLEKRRLEVLQVLAEVERRTGIVRGTARGCEFDHHQLQEVVREGVPPLLRAEYHGLLADACAERSSLSADDPADAAGPATAFLAEHWLRAGRPSDAARVLRRALSHLAAVHRHEAVLELGALAREAASALGPSLLSDVLVDESWALGMLGRPGERRDALDEAIRLARSAGDASRTWRARRNRALLLVYLAELDEATRELLELADEAGDAGDAAREASALHGLGIALGERGDLPEALGHLSRCAKLARDIGDRRLELMALTSSGDVLGQRGEHAAAGERHEAALDVAREIGSANFEATNLVRLAVTVAALGDAASARTHAAASLALFREVGHRSGEARVLCELGVLTRDAGDLAAARRHLEEALNLAEDIGYAPGTVAVALHLARVALLEGDLAEVADDLAACEALAQAFAVHRLRVQRALVAGELARARGDADAARAAAEEAREAAERAGARQALAEASVLLARLAVDADDPDAAAGPLEEAAGIVAELGLATPGALPAAWLARCGRRDPATVDVPEVQPVAVRAEAHALLAAAGAGANHSARARELADALSVHLTGAAREAFRAQSPVGRLVAH